MKQIINEIFEEDHKAGGRAFHNEIFNVIKTVAPHIKPAPEELDTDAKFKFIMEQIPVPDRRMVSQKVTNWFHREESKLKAERALKRGQIDHLNFGVGAYEKILGWLQFDMRLQKPIDPMLYAFRDALEAGHVFDTKNQHGEVPAADLVAWKEMAESASVYIVQHNWADAFKNAKDYVGGEIKLPDDVCAFEFRINDRHVIVFATSADGVLYLQHAIQVKKGWFLLPVTTGANEYDLLTDLTDAQVRAIAVALDAEVATTEVVRAPYKKGRNSAERGKLPIISHHIVNLSRRTRAAPLERQEGEPRYRVRLHFRRGHWRHYDDHKTWINWMLVGSPELGFIDKEYRL